MKRVFVMMFFIGVLASNMDAERAALELKIAPTFIKESNTSQAVFSLIKTLHEHSVLILSQRVVRPSEYELVLVAAEGSANLPSRFIFQKGYPYIWDFVECVIVLSITPEGIDTSGSFMMGLGEAITVNLLELSQEDFVNRLIFKTLEEQHQ